MDIRARIRPRSCGCDGETNNAVVAVAQCSVAMVGEEISMFMVEGRVVSIDGKKRSAACRCREGETMVRVIGDLCFGNHPRLELIPNFVTVNYLCPLDCSEAHVFGLLRQIPHKPDNPSPKTAGSIHERVPLNDAVVGVPTSGAAEILGTVELETAQRPSQAPVHPASPLEPLDISTRQASGR